MKTKSESELRHDVNGSEVTLRGTVRTCLITIREPVAA